MKIKFLSVAATALLLTACVGGSGPSEKAVRNIALAEFEQMAALAAMFTPASELQQARDVIGKLKLKSCEKETRAPAMYGEDAYACDIEFSDPSNKGKKEGRKVFLAKIDGDWIAPRGIIK